MTQKYYDLKMTSRRRFDVFMTLLLRHVSVGNLGWNWKKAWLLTEGNMIRLHNLPTVGNQLTNIMLLNRWIAIRSDVGPDCRGANACLMRHNCQGINSTTLNFEKKSNTMIKFFDIWNISDKNACFTIWKMIDCVENQKENNSTRYVFCLYYRS